MLAQAVNQEEELLEKLSLAKGEDRLPVILQLQQFYLYEPMDWVYNNQLLTEARDMQNIKYQSIALTNRVAYYYRKFHTDSVFFYAEKAEQFHRKHNCYKDLYLAKQMLLFRLFDQGKYSEGLDMAMNIFDEIQKLDNRELMITGYVIMADSYKYLGFNTEAIRYFKEARAQGFPGEESPYKVLECFESMANCYQNMNMKDSLFVYTDSLDMEINKINIKYPTFNVEEFKISVLLYKSFYYIEQKEYEKAWRYIEKADSMIEGKAFPIQSFLSDEKKMRYYNAIGNYEKANQYYNICLNYTKSRHWESETRNLLRFKAVAYAKQGRNTEAIEVYKEMERHIDSINKERFLTDLNHFRISHIEEKAKDEILYHKERYRLTAHLNILFSILVIILLFTCILIWIHLRAMKKKNYSLFLQLKDLSETKMKLLQFKEMVQMRISNNQDSRTTEDKLYDKVETFMNKSLPYLNSDYSRKDLIQDMGTNETYLSKAIRKGMNMSINEYIKHWRVEYAKYTLLQDMNLTIEQIAYDSGFSSLRNFYRTFKDAYGMSPSEFRNYVKK